MDEDEFTVGSLYAGVGGICLGFKQAGFKLKWANEFDKNACKTYRENFNHTLIEEDVMKIDISNLKNISVLTAGFPCQPFSIAGYRNGFDDKRGNHFFKIIEFVQDINNRPKVLFLENVKNLHTHDNKRTFQVIRKSIRDAGYSFNAQILNTKDFGNIPHNRERIFIIAFDAKYYNKNIDDINFEFPEPEELTRTIRDIVSRRKVDKKFYYGPDKYMYPMLEETMVKEDTVYQFRRQYVRENKSGVCPTLTANMGTGGHNVPLVKIGKKFRKLTPRECFSFQGFPETYNLPELANSHLYKQAGNSVSVPVINRIASNIATQMNLLEEERLGNFNNVNSENKPLKKRIA